MAKRIQASAMTISNPWRTPVNGDSWLQSQDREIVSEFHALPRVEKDEKFRLRFELVPEPYLGNLDLCRVILLGCNPGFSAENAIEQRDHPDFVVALKSNLLESRAEGTLCFDPRFKCMSVSRYWRAVVDPIYQALKAASSMHADELWAQMSESVAIADHYGYHSTSGWPEKLRELPSSQYTYSRVRKAFEERNVLLVNVWKHDPWVNIWNRKLGLGGNQHDRFLMTTEGTNLGPTALGKDSFNKIVAAIRPDLKGTRP